MHRGSSSTMTGVILFRGPAHVIQFQSELILQLMGPLMGLPAREALCDEGRYVPMFKLMDDVYETGVSMKVKTPRGLLWILRLEDRSGVAFHYEREHALLPSAPPPALVPLALAR